MKRPFMRVADVELISALAEAITLIAAYRLKANRTKKDYWTLYGQLTVVWVELNTYLNQQMRDDQ